MALPSHVACFSSKAALEEGLGEYIAESLPTLPGARYTIAVSGGSVPTFLGAALKRLAAGRDLHTESWHVFYVDERVVPLDHADSNHAAVQAALYSQDWWKGTVHCIAANLPSAQAVAAEYEAQVAAVFGADGGVPHFDLVILGMGPDGHCASLFPGHALLHETESLVAFIEDSPKPPPRRVTFTYKLINAAKRVCFVATGEGKSATLVHVFDPSVEPGAALPAARVRQGGGDRLPTWFIDEAAAAGLRSQIDEHSR